MLLECVITLSKNDFYINRKLKKELKKYKKIPVFDTC